MTTSTRYGRAPRLVPASDDQLEQIPPKFRKGASSRYYSPQIFFLCFIATGIVCWGLFSYNQRGMAELLRGQPQGRKYLAKSSDRAQGEQPLGEKEVTLYVIPGGGSGSGDEGEGVLNYPEWSRRRTIAAVEHAKQNRQPAKDKDGAYFLALSAGSLNSPNRLTNPSNQIIFECTHTINHLLDLGVPRERIFGDFMSWDTISNAMVLRMTLKGILEKNFGYLVPGEDEEEEEWSSNSFFWKFPNPRGSGTDNGPGPQGKVNVEVFISDFHLERVEAAFQWLLTVKPSLSPRVKMTMHSVGSEGIPGLSFFGQPDMWGNPAPVSETAKAEFVLRQEHEKRGLEQIRANKKKIKSEGAFLSWMILGGHHGFSKYLDSSYHSSQGAGW